MFPRFGRFQPARVPLRCRILLTCAAILLPAVGFAQDLAPAAETRITGIVTDAATGAPLQSVSVTVHQRTGNQLIWIGTRTTDAAGVYSFDGLPFGIYYAWTSNSIGYTDEIYGGVLCAGSCSETTAFESGTGITVGIGPQPTGIDFALDVGGGITGTVTNALTSAPVPNAAVIVVTRLGNDTFMRRVSSSFTDASGSYTIQGLPAGAYYLSTHNGIGLLNEMYENIQCPGICDPTPEAPGLPVPVTRGTTTASVDFQLEPGGSVTGMVTDSATSLPLPTTTVVLYRAVGNAAVVVGSADANGGGTYTVIGLPTGAYFARAMGAFTHAGEVYDNIPCPIGCLSATILSGVPIAVTAGATTSGKNFALDSAGRITGTVTDALTSLPLASMHVLVFSRVGTTPVSAGTGFTNSSGVFVVGGLPSGTYYAFTSAPSAARLTNEIYDDVPCANDSCSASTATSTGMPITVTGGTTTAGIDFGLFSSTSPPSAPTNLGAVVSGFRVTFSWSPPSSGASATSYILEAGVAPGTTAVTFNTTPPFLEIPGAPPGTYYIRVRGVNAFGTGPASNDYLLIINPDGSGVPSPPLKLAAWLDGRRLTMTWAAPTSGIVPTGYSIEVGTATGLADVGSLFVTTRYFTYQPVPDGVYFLRVRSWASRLSPPSPEIMLKVGNLASPPEAPRALLDALSASTVTLTWSAPLSGAPTSYVIEAGTYTGLTNIGVFDTGSTVTSATFTDVPSGTYYVRTRAVNAAGRSVVSNERVVVVP